MGFRHSTDAGAAWVEPRLNATGPTDNLFRKSPFHNTTSNQVRFPMPHWVDFGKNMEHSPEGKAYVVSHGNDGTSTGSDEAWTLGNQVFMARVVLRRLLQSTMGQSGSFTPAVQCRRTRSG